VYRENKIKMKSYIALVISCGILTGADAALAKEPIEPISPNKGAEINLA